MGPERRRPLHLCGRRRLHRQGHPRPGRRAHRPGDGRDRLGHGLVARRRRRPWRRGAAPPPPRTPRGLTESGPVVVGPGRPTTTDGRASPLPPARA
ncbi:hypothetical protein FDF08_00755 [Micrococcus luteus]|nr:hypothetical protein FDF08_00755 [Micrococcus luteus]